MDDDSLSSLIALGLLLLLHGALVAAYTALTNYRTTALKERAESGDKRAQRVLNLAENRSQLYVTQQLMLTAVRFAIVTVAVVRFVQPFAASQTDGLFADPVWAYIVVLLPIGLLTYILADLVAYTLGMSYADQLLPFAAPIMRWLSLILNPLVVVLAALQRGVSEVSGGEELEKAVTEEEILSMLEVGQRGGSIESSEKEMIYSVFQFDETIAREIMIPRPDITAVEINAPIEELLKVIIESGHSRIPVYEEEIDNIKGMIYAKDLLKAMQNGALKGLLIRDLMRKPYLVPDTKRADDLLKEMKKSKTHIAVLVDEYGSTAGLVTIEDLVEEIVGDIKDEYDLNEEAEYVKVSDNVYIIDGAMNLDDLNDLLDVEIPTDDADTLGGYIISLIGGVPQVGQVVETDELIMRVESIDNRRVRKVHVTRIQPPDSGERAEADAKAEAKADAKAAKAEAKAARDASGGVGAAEPRIASFRLFT